MPAKPIFIGATGSHAGKSWVATAICRYLYRMGYRVAPFKAQNMSNNSMVCPGGGEIGRAQAAQAEACGLEPHTDMNPILLKPTGNLGSQVIVNGRPWRNLTAAEYYEQFDLLLDQVLSSYNRLAANYDYIVVEGAGSITELNLKHCDLVNLGFAKRINAPCILVADIDRGGVFASVTGTFQFLDPDEYSLVRTFLINRFRGDVRLFHDGVSILESRTGRRCLGVFPYAPDIDLDPEDSLSLDQRGALSENRVAIVRLPHISNFTDFRLFPGARYLSHPLNEQFDTIFLPGTKNTIDDLLWLRSSGMELWLRRQIRDGATIIGVCGGFQMMGEAICDPAGVESTTPAVQGLGLIPMTTQLTQDKTTRTVEARTPSGIRFQAYEIHMGVTSEVNAAPPFALLEDGSRDGIRLPGIVGTYLHGAFEDKAVMEELLGHPLARRLDDTKQVHYDRLADWFSTHIDRETFAAEYMV